MRSIHVAEWILGLVTNRERAASTVGDLVEQTPARGAVWFWFGILRTAASLLWRGLADNPVRVTAVAMVGVAIDIVASLLLAGLSGLVFFVGARNAHQAPWSSGWWMVGLDGLTLIVSVLVGRILARSAPGR